MAWCTIVTKAVKDIRPEPFILSNYVSILCEVTALRIGIYALSSF